MKKKVLVCVGTRPNFIKITQLEKAFSQYPSIEYLLLHTGQHYDEQMNTVFFTELKIKKPDVQFTLNSGSQIAVITQIMNQFEAVCAQIQPDLVVVPGDVNSSFACAFVASRMGIPVAHIESGLRSFDMTMPEEANRILIDKLSSLHFVTEKSGLKHLEAEGYSANSIKFVGNSMIDSLIAFDHYIDLSDVLKKNNLTQNQYALFTFHRPINVDNALNLEKLLLLIEKTAQRTKVIFPVHPRTLANFNKFNLSIKHLSEDVVFCNPLSYFDFLKLIKHAKIVITDSGGVQEETTFLNIPCLTVRPNTERPVTVELGTNTLVDFEIENVLAKINEVFDGAYKKGAVPMFWDGKVSERIASEINTFLN